MTASAATNRVTDIVRPDAGHDKATRQLRNRVKAEEAFVARHCAKCLNIEKVVVYAMVLVLIIVTEGGAVLTTNRLPSNGEVTALLELFRSGDGSALIADSNFEKDLRVVLRVTLTGELLLNSTRSPSRSRDDDSIDMFRDDIRSAIEFFEHVETIALRFNDIERRSWPWPKSMTWSAFRDAYARDIAKLRSPRTALSQRYGALVRLIRQQLALWAITFGLSTRGYVG
jgi:hypothetical protein